MKKLNLLMVLLGILCLGNINAQKIGGGEIYYNQFAHHKYEVTAIVYRKCNGNGLNQLSAYVISDSFKTIMNMKRIGISRINDTCGNPCNILNASGNDGYEKHVFLDTVDFTKAPFNKYVNAGNCMVRFAVHQFLRDTTFTTLTPGKFYLEAKVNICQNFKSSRSPQFSIEPKFKVCCNQQMVYNPGYIDTVDFDSLVISLESPLTDVNTPVNYAGSFNKSIPMTPYCPPNPGVLNCRALPGAKPPRGFYFDSETGDIALTPTKCDEISALRFLVKEFRKDSSNQFVLIGEVSREMQTRVFQCPNNYVPYILSVNNLSVCEQNTLCVSGNAKDDQFQPKQTTPDTVTLFWDYGLPTGKFTIQDSNSREKSFQFCWNTNLGPKNGKYHFTLAAYDKSCNIGLTSKGILFTKKAKANYTKRFWVDNCNTLHYEIIPVDSNNKAIYTYNVKIAHQNNPFSFVYYSNKSSDSFNAQMNGLHIITTTVNNLNNCPVIEYDTITLATSAVNISNNPYELFCFGDTLNFKPLNDNFDQYHFDWYDDELSNSIVDTGKTYQIVINKMKRKVRLNVTLGNGCILTDTIDIYRRGAFTFDPNQQFKTVCEGKDTLRIEDLKGTAPFNILWLSNGDTLSTGTSCYLDNNDDRQIHVTVTDFSNCSASDTFNIHVSKLPSIGMNDTITCLNSNINIVPTYIPATSGLKYQWTLDSTISSNIKSTYFFTVRHKHQLKLKITDSNQCAIEKTIQVDAWPLPNFIILTDTIYNKAHFIHLSTDKAFTSYNWFNGVQTRDNDFWAYTLGAPGRYTIWCEVTDSNGCKSKQQLSIETNGKTGLENLNVHEVSFYPNPASNILNIVSTENIQVELFDMEGKLMLSKSLESGENTFSLEHLASGIYTVKIDGKAYKLVIFRE